MKANESKRSTDDAKNLIACVCSDYKEGKEPAAADDLRTDVSFAPQVAALKVHIGVTE